MWILTQPLWQFFHNDAATFADQAPLHEGWVSEKSANVSAWQLTGNHGRWWTMNHVEAFSVDGGDPTGNRWNLAMSQVNVGPDLNRNAAIPTPKTLSAAPTSLSMPRSASTRSYGHRCHRLIEVVHRWNMMEPDGKMLNTFYSKCFSPVSFIWGPLELLWLDCTEVLPWLHI